MANTNETNERTIRALLEERKSVEKRGLSERVEAINEQLRLFGHEAEKPVERAEKRVVEAPEARVSAAPRTRRKKVDNGD